MKRVKMVDITQIEPLKVNRHVDVLTNKVGSSKGECMEDKEVAYSDHITVEESSNSNELI